MLLERKKTDEAMRVLERAVNIDPNNGRNYYYLAEAWLVKGNRSQASNFNQLAGIYLRGDSGWLGKVERQRERIAGTE
jgi:predicted Zn-dependent protease